MTNATDTVYKEVVKEVAPVEMEALGTASVEMVSPELVVPIIDAPDVEVPTMNTVVESSAIPEIQSPMVDVAATEVASPSVEVSSPIVDVITPSVEVPEAKTDVEAVTGSDDLRTDSPPLVTDTITETPDARGDDIMAMVAPNVEMSEIRTPAPVVGQGDMAATTIEVPQAHVIVDSPEVIASTAPMVTVAMPEAEDMSEVAKPTSVADVDSLELPVVNIENTPTIEVQEVTLPNAPPTSVIEQEVMTSEVVMPSMTAGTIEVPQAHVIVDSPDVIASTAPMVTVAMPDMATGDAVIPPAPAPAVEVPAVDVPPTVVENNVVETVSPSVADIGSLDMPVVNIENTPTIDAQEITLPNAPPTLVLQEYEAPESGTDTIERERIEERGSTDDSGAQTAPVNNVTVNFTINQTPGQDPEELARVILRHIDQSTETFLIQ